MIEDMGSSSDLNRQDEPSKPQQEAHGSAKSKSVRFNLADTNYIRVATRNELGPKEIENAWYGVREFAMMKKNRLYTLKLIRRGELDDETEDGEQREQDDQPDEREEAIRHVLDDREALARTE